MKSQQQTPYEKWIEAEFPNYYDDNNDNYDNNDNNDNEKEDD